ncbi:MAG: class I SAM-dependent methyltransferase [Geminicoccaceae bacterium]
MSRLDSFIRRLEAQRACLNLAANAIGVLPGPVLELGLGNGRTYDHLRQLLPDRDIYVLEREVRAHPDCIPDDDHLILGQIEETLAELVSRLSGEVALIHSDIGTGDASRNQELAAWLAQSLPPLLKAGAWIVGDQALPNPSFVPEALPEGIAANRYFVYRYR